MHIHTNTHTLTHTHAHTYIQTQTHTYRYKYTYTYSDMHRRALFKPRPDPVKGNGGSEDFTFDILYFWYSVKLKCMTNK